MNELIKLIESSIKAEKKRRQERFEIQQQLNKWLAEHCTPFFEMISIINTSGTIVFGKYEQSLSCYLTENKNKPCSLDEVKNYLLENGNVSFYVGPDCNKHDLNKMIAITFTIGTNKLVHLTLEFEDIPKTFNDINLFNEYFLKTIMPHAIFK